MPGRHSRLAGARIGAETERRRPVRRPCEIVRRAGEIEDEGACYAFELDVGRIAFIQGQEFYESARFPSLDFSLAYVLDEADQSVDTLIDKRGAKAAPARRIPAAVKQRLDVPDHLEVRKGRIADLEDILATSSPRA